MILLVSIHSLMFPHAHTLCHTCILTLPLDSGYFSESWEVSLDNLLLYISTAVPSVSLTNEGNMRELDILTWRI